MTDRNVLNQILDMARWAPSGDNTQPWRFDVQGDDLVLVRGFDTREHCVYDIDGHPSQIAIGALLETLSIAASAHGLRAEVVRLESPDDKPVFQVKLIAQAGLAADPLIEAIKVRAVQRRPMSTRPLSVTEKQGLDASVGAGYSVVWVEGFDGRLAAAKLMFSSAKIRLTTPEAFEVHRKVIEWNARFSIDRIPDQAVGLDPMTTRLMAWVMQDWRRVEFFNKFLMGTIPPRIQLDFLPGLGCAAHFMIAAREQAKSLDDFVAAGRAMQRFWLTATRMGLFLQPEMTPLIFSMYARDARQFSVKLEALDLADGVRAGLRALVGPDAADRGVFMGRLGAGPAPRARSTRLSLDQLNSGVVS